MPNKAIIWVDGEGNGIVLHCMACGEKSNHLASFPSLRCDCTMEYATPEELRKAYVVLSEADE